jgi:hypothetical protein
MRVATCAVCGERLNLLREKLVTAEWVDSASGALVAMQFHSPCFVRWYQESASARAGPAEAPDAAPAPAPEPAGEGKGVPKGTAATGAAGGAASPEAPAPETSPPPEDLFSVGERERLRQLRRRREDQEAGTEPPEGPPQTKGGPGAGTAGDAGAGPESGSAPGQQPEGDQHGVREDDQAPQHE